MLCHPEKPLVFSFARFKGVPVFMRSRFAAVIMLLAIGLAGCNKKGKLQRVGETPTASPTVSPSASTSPGSATAGAGSEFVVPGLPFAVEGFAAEATPPGTAVVAEKIAG